MDNHQLLEKLEKHPKLKVKFIELLQIVERENLKLADDAELEVRKTVNGIGKESLETWAKNQEIMETKKIKKQDVPKHRKKNCTGTPPMEK